MKTHLLNFLAAMLVGLPAIPVAAGSAEPSVVSAAKQADRPAPRPKSIRLSDTSSEPVEQSAAALPRLGPPEEFDLDDDSGAEPVQYVENIPSESFGPPPPGCYCSPGSCEPYQWHLLPQGLIYRSYLAGAKESRFRGVWHEDEDLGTIWDCTLGGNVGLLLRYGTRGDAQPEGWQLGIEGAGMVRLDRENESDVMATDYRFGVPLTWGDSIHQVKLAYYHLSSHVGDEFLLRNPGFNRLNYSRDTLVLGNSLYPTDNFRVYGEVGYAFYVDVCEPWEFQFGVDYSPSGRTGLRGAPFAAVNGHLREEVDFSGNLVAQTGWAWRRSAAGGLYRVGVEYYNGKEDQFSFFDNSVEKIGVGMWYDY